MNGTALTLGLSSLSLALFPLVRPYFPFDPTNPAETLAGAAPAVTSARWLIAHYLALVGFVLLVCALPALGAVSHAGCRIWVIGVGVMLILPTLGIELYTLPAIGRLYLDGNTSVALLLRPIYLRGAAPVMLIGLVLLAVGATILAVAMVRRNSVMPRWTVIVYAMGLALWCPLFPPIVRMIDGVLIGVGGLTLAWNLLRSTALASALPHG